MAESRTLGWLGIIRLGLVQTALGAIVVLTTSTLNRVMVVELALPAMLPGILVALHYFVQITRPRFGFGSDAGRRRTPWIVGGMTVLGAGGVLAAAATAWMQTAPAAGVALAVFAFLLIGAGVGASGTCLLVLLAAGVEPRRRAAAASITWIMMIAGFAVTAGVVGAHLDPFSFPRLIAISAMVATAAVTVTALAIRGLEDRIGARPEATPAQGDGGPQTTFRQALAEVLAEPHTRRFATFVFISMLAYSAQDLVLEPFAGAVFGLTPGESTQLGGTQHGGVLLGMLLVGLIGYLAGKGRDGVLRACMIVGCLGSAALLASLGVAGFLPTDWPLRTTVFALGVANGAFAVAAIGSMMALVSRGHRQRDGVRMGLWGAAQAIAFGLGGVAGTLAVDIVRYLTGSVQHAYSLVFAAQALLFAVAAVLAARITRRAAGPTRSAPVVLGVEAGST
jgi:BCD family chlorophyll transporter-like MFS transporter